MAPALVACPSCSQHVKLYETHCLHCGARLRSDAGGIRRTAGAVLMGLSLTGCPSDDSAETMGSGGTSTGDPGTMSGTSSDSSTGSTTMDPSGTEAEYGVPETGETFETTGGSDSTSVTATESDTDASSSSSSGSMETESSGGVEDTGSSDTGTPMTTGGTDVTTGIEPLYGVMTTGVEPEYGVATTGIEPDYGVGDPA